MPRPFKKNGLDHPFDHILGRGGYAICPYSLDQTMIKAKKLMGLNIFLTPFFA